MTTDALHWTDATSRPGASAWRELWDARELVWMFALRDLQVRYRQTAVGVAWVLLQPLVQAALFSVFFGLLQSKPAEADAPYAVVVLCGLIVWQFFAQSVQLSTGILVANRTLITKVYFPRAALPLSTVLAAAVDFCIGWVLIGIVCLCVGVMPGISWLWTPLVGLGVGVVAFSVAVWTSSLNAYYRDIGYVVPFVLQTGFFLSPVVFATSALIPPAWQPLAALNPLGTLIELFRAGWLHGPLPPWWSLLISAAITLGLLGSGLWYFQRVERYLADFV